MLTQQIAALSQQLAALDKALDLKQTAIDAQGATIADLGQRLNLALANKVEELTQYRSEFFGELKKALGSREDVRIVGDRFVFQSEVLFASAPRTLPAELHDLAVIAPIVEHDQRRTPADVEQGSVPGRPVRLQVAHAGTQQREIAREILRVRRRDPATGEHDLSVAIGEQLDRAVELDRVELAQALR